MLKATSKDDSRKWTMSFAKDLSKNNWHVLIERLVRFLAAIGLGEGEIIEIDDRRALAVAGELADRLR